MARSDQQRNECREEHGGEAEESYPENLPKAAHPATQSTIAE